MPPLSRRHLLAGAAAGIGALACRARLADADVREVTARFAAQPSRDGAGVALRRSLGTRALPLLDPFLLLDEIHSADPRDYEAGFPSHPHRGFETVSILLAGAFEHRDVLGNHGLIDGGGAQWMTAGRGIIHSEMPRRTTGDDLWGLQLWVNLPAAHKMTRPRYQDLTASDVVAADLGAARARIIAGAAGGRRGPVDGIVVAPTLLDVTLPAAEELRLELPPAHTAFAYVLDGALALGARAEEVRAGHLAPLGPGSALLARATATTARFLVVAAAPIGEPVARRGPFVMSTEAELDQAVADYRSGRLVDG